jgi:hypothetical protein
LQTPGFINTQSEAGGWPVLEATKTEIARASSDRDKDGIPDYYEKNYFGGNVNPNARCKVAGYTQYTNMDYYLARLCQDFVTNFVSSEYTVGNSAGKFEALGNETGRYSF